MPRSADVAPSVKCGEPQVSGLAGVVEASEPQLRVAKIETQLLEAGSDRSLGQLEVVDQVLQIDACLDRVPQLGILSRSPRVPLSHRSPW